MLLQHCKFSPLWDTSGPVRVHPPPPCPWRLCLEQAPNPKIAPTAHTTVWNERMGQTPRLHFPSGINKLLLLLDYFNISCVHFPLNCGCNTAKDGLVWSDQSLTLWLAAITFPYIFLVISKFGRLSVKSSQQRKVTYVTEDEEKCNRSPFSCKTGEETFSGLCCKVNTLIGVWCIHLVQSVAQERPRLWWTHALILSRLLGTRK